MSVSAFIHRHPIATLVLLALATAAAAVPASRVAFESRIEIWFLEDDPALRAYDAHTRAFHADEIAVIAVSDDDLFSDRGFASLERVAARAAAVTNVHRVRSLLDFDLEPVTDFEAAAASAAPDWDAVRQAARENSLVVPTLLADDGATAAILVEIERAANTVAGKRALVAALDEIAAEEAARSGHRIDVTGTPVLDVRALDHSEADLATVHPLIAPLVLLTAWLVFGRLGAALAPLAVVAITAVWALALMGLLDMKATLLTSAMLPLFLVVGVADSIHVLAECERQRASRVDAPMGPAVRRMWRPCLFTTLTTAAGLLALTVSPLRPVREFGLVAAAGVAVALVVTMTLLPALARLGLLRTRPTRALAGFRRVAEQCALPPPGWRRMTAPTAAIVAAGALIAALHMEVGVDPMSWFRQADPFRTATEHVDRRLGGAGAVELLVRGTARDLREPTTLHALDAFERWIERETVATRCLSTVDLVKEATRAVSDAPYRYPRLPEIASLTGMLIDALAASGELERWSSQDFRLARVSCRVPLGATANLGDELAAIEAEIERRFRGSALSVTPTGYAALVVRMEDHLVSSQIRSLGVAFAAVAVAFAVLFRSALLAALAMIPNLLPVLCGLAAMPLLGITLNPGTVMVAAVALGIVADDTTHLVVAARRHLDAGLGAEEAMRAAVREVGSAIVATTLVLVGSMAILTLSRFAPAVHFALIAIVIGATALVCDLTLLPRLLAATHASRRPELGKI